MAFYDNAANYESITGLLNAALDDSFARDPVFGPPAPYFMMGGLRRGSAYAMSPRFPNFPLPAFAAQAQD
jgi:hypothetical protein